MELHGARFELVIRSGKGKKGHVTVTTISLFPPSDDHYKVGSPSCSSQTTHVLKKLKIKIKRLTKRTPEGTRPRGTLKPASDVPGLEQALGNKEASRWLVPRSTVKMVQRKQTETERTGAFQKPGEAAWGRALPRLNGAGQPRGRGAVALSSPLLEAEGQGTTDMRTRSSRGRPAPRR